MNFRRRHRRELGARSRSSDWSYIQLEKGNDQRGTPSTKRRLTAFEADLQEWLKDPVFREEYEKATQRLTSSVG